MKKQWHKNVKFHHVLEHFGHCVWGKSKPYIISTSAIQRNVIHLSIQDNDVMWLYQYILLEIPLATETYCWFLNCFK